MPEHDFGTFHSGFPHYEMKPQLLRRVLVQTSELAWAATMTGMPARQRTPELFKGLHFDHEVAILCVRWRLWPRSCRSVLRIWLFAFTASSTSACRSAESAERRFTSTAVSSCRA